MRSLQIFGSDSGAEAESLFLARPMQADEKMEMISTKKDQMEFKKL
jgi:hypothetical protein